MRRHARHPRGAENSIFICQFPNPIYVSTCFTLYRLPPAREQLAARYQGEYIVCHLISVIKDIFQELMNIDKPTMEPKIPDPLLGVSREILGDPCGGDGGGGGQRRMGEWSRGRRSAERRQMRDWSRGRRSSERRQMRVESRRNIVWRSNRDGTWRRVVMEDDREVQILSERVLMPPAKSSSNLEANVSMLRSGIVGSHTIGGAIFRICSIDDVPSSNLHHFVENLPHSRHEQFPSTDIRMRSVSVKGKKILNIKGFVT